MKREEPARIAGDGGRTVGYSHRGEGRHPVPIRIERPKAERTLDERFLTTPIPANVLPGDRGVVGDWKTGRPPADEPGGPAPAGGTPLGGAPVPPRRASEPSPGPAERG